MGSKPGSMSSVDRRRRRVSIARRDGEECHYCDIELTDDNWTFDHLLPKTLGGSNALDNLVLACHECNNARGHMEYESFKRLMKEALDKPGPLVRPTFKRWWATRTWAEQERYLSAQSAARQMRERRAGLSSPPETLEQLQSYEPSPIPRHILYVSRGDKRTLPPTPEKIKNRLTYKPFKDLDKEIEIPRE